MVDFDKYPINLILVFSVIFLFFVFTSILKNRRKKKIAEINRLQELIKKEIEKQRNTKKWEHQKEIYLH